MSRPSEHVAGTGYALAAYGAWGVLPLYWKLLEGVGAVEVLAHRVVWSVVFFVVLLTALRRWRFVRDALRSRRTIALLSITTALISVNWGLFIWSIHSGQLLEASLGYFINPLVTVALGVVVLRERLDRVQRVAVGIAGAGVLWLGVSLGVTPWIALTLAVSFALYGLLRKIAGVPPLAGLFVETTLCAPIALAFLALREHGGEGSFGHAGLAVDLLLAGAGVVTALPLLWFTAAANRLPLSSLGLFQYLAPTLQFVIAVVAFGEAFTTAHAVAFASIWLALALYTASSKASPRA